MKKTSARWLVAAVAAVAAMLAMATPASATVHPFVAEFTSGTISVGPFDFETPGAGVEECPEGETIIEGEVDDVTGDVLSTLDITAPFDIPFGGYGFLDAVGTGSGTYTPGPPTANPATMVIAYDIDFVIYDYSGPPECEVGEVICEGTASLEIHAEDPDFPPHTWPPFDPSDRIEVTTNSGQIDTVDPDPCPGILGFGVYSGSPLSIQGIFTVL